MAQYRYFIQPTKDHRDYNPDTPRACYKVGGYHYQGTRGNLRELWTILETHLDHYNKTHTPRATLLKGVKSTLKPKTMRIGKLYLIGQTSIGNSIFLYRVF